MGSAFSTFFQVYWEPSLPEHIPYPYVKPGFEPNFGFKRPRLPRVSHVSQEEMKALQVHPERRDYCAHYFRDYVVCMKKYTPFHGLCSPESNAHKHCLVDDFILRMKEYEREKRLRIRQMRKEGKVV